MFCRINSSFWVNASSFETSATHLDDVGDRALKIRSRSTRSWDHPFSQKVSFPKFLLPPPPRDVLDDPKVFTQVSSSETGLLASVPESQSNHQLPDMRMLQHDGIKSDINHSHALSWVTGQKGGSHWHNSWASSNHWPEWYTVKLRVGGRHWKLYYLCNSDEAQP